MLHRAFEELKIDLREKSQQLLDAQQKIRSLKEKLLNLQNKLNCLQSNLSDQSALKRLSATFPDFNVALTIQASSSSSESLIPKLCWSAQLEYEALRVVANAPTLQELLQQLQGAVSALNLARDEDGSL